jgi:hypothetical protein
MTDDAAPRRQISVWVRNDLVRWLRVRAAERDITRSQLIEELIEAEQRGSDS